MPLQVEPIFPHLHSAIAVLGDQFQREAKQIRIPAGQFICMQGQACSSLALVVSGSVRVYKSGGSGRELTLYRVEKGGSCILTASCILNQRHFPAYAVTETEVEAIVVPAPTFHRWVSEHSAWQQYVFQLLSERLEAVVEVVEEIAFRRLDSRLAAHLLQMNPESVASGDVHITHEALASELGSSREVISRLLKDFEREGLVSLRRGLIHLEDTAALAVRAGRM